MSWQKEIEMNRKLLFLVLIVIILAVVFLILSNLVFVSGITISGVEAGCWLIKGDDGKSYLVDKMPNELKKENQKVFVVAKKLNNFVSICMQGDFAISILYFTKG